MDQTVFAKATGISEEELEIIEAGDAGEIGLITAKKIAAFAGVHVSELFLRT